MLKKITIIGLGMMGASLSLAVKKRMPGIRTVAIVRKEKYVKTALKKKIVDEIHVGLNAEALDADIIVIAVPVFSILSMMDEIKPFLKKETIITDIGSVKKIIMEHAEKHYGDSFAFIGSHPMCGSEKSGMEHASADLFEDATCILTAARTSNPDPAHVEMLAVFWKSLGSRILIMNAADHDRYVALVSHMPHLLSSILMNHVYDKNEGEHNILNVAGSGFSDMTRLSEGQTSVWMDIFEANRDYLIEAVSGYKESLEEILELLQKNDPVRLSDYLEKGSERKKHFEECRVNWKD